jgi:hypothetical protein
MTPELEIFEAGLPADKCRTRIRFTGMTAVFLWSVTGIILMAHFRD